MRFNLQSEYQPKGDQPAAIDALVRGLNDGAKDQVLLGITGSGKTFTVASVIQRTQRSTLVLAHNKTLAAQLFQEFRTLFPDNAVEYFVSYYDYYQPEAYVPAADVYIEKEALPLMERLRASLEGSPSGKGRKKTAHAPAKRRAAVPRSKKGAQRRTSRAA